GNGGAGNGGWPLQPAIEPPVPVPPPAAQPRAVRDYRAPLTDEPWVAPEPQTREPAPRPRPQDNIGSITGMAAESNARLSPDLDSPAPPPRPAQAPTPAPAHEPSASPQTDRNLAEMAQRLEAALRRPNTRDDNA